jgi:hypothetical protein
VITARSHQVRMIERQLPVTGYGQAAEHRDRRLSRCLRNGELRTFRTYLFSLAEFTSIEESNELHSQTPTSGAWRHSMSPTITSMRNKLLIIAGVLVLIGAAATGTLYAYWDQAVPLAGMAINYARSWSAPSGTTTTELAAAAPEAAGAPSAVARPPEATAGDWPSYNKTLT